MAKKTASLEERLQANPDSLIFARMAEECRKSGDIAKAIDLCVRGIEKHPGYITGHIILGRCYADLENFKSAAEAFSSARRLDRRSMAATKMLADSYMRLGEPEKAGDLYAQLGAIDPWNETFSHMAGLVRSPGAPLQSEISGQATGENEQEISEAQPDAVMESEPPAEIEIAENSPVMQEPALLEPAVIEITHVENKEAAPQPAENSGENDSFSETVTVTGNDISDRMAMLFGESGEGGKPAREAAPPADREIAASLTDETVETLEVLPIDTLPDGNTISARIDDLFSRDTLKMPAIKEASETPDALRAGEAGKPPVAAPPNNSEFEETMIMDAAEVKSFLREDTAAQGASQKAAAEDDLISDDRSEAAVMEKNGAELVVDENDAGDTVTGDDIVRQMAGFFEEEDDKATAGVAGTETADAFFKDVGSAAPEAELLPVGPSAVDSPLPAAIAEAEAALFVEATPFVEREIEATAVEDDMLTGDDVAGRIAGMFSGAEKGHIASAGEEPDGRPPVEDKKAADAGEPPEADVIEDTVVENAGTPSGSDVEERLNEYFKDIAGPAEKKGPPDSAGETVRLDDRKPLVEVDKKAEHDETVIAGDIDAIDLASGSIDGNNTASIHGADEEVLVEAALPLEETLEVLEPAGSIEAPVSGGEDDKEATAVFTEFSPAPDAPPPPPEVPLFTVQASQQIDEETVVSEIPDGAVGAEPPEPDIPDHVLTPTLADIYLEQGQPRLALNIYRRLQEKRPENEKLKARIKEIEKALADGIVAAGTLLQAEKSAALRKKKKAAGVASERKKKESEDTRPLAGVRLKKRPGTTWRKK